MLTSRSLRLVRGWSAASVATAAAVLAHAVAGGQWPSLLLILLCVTLSAPVCMLLAGVRMPWLGLTGSVAVSQGLFHHLLAASGTMRPALDTTGHGAQGHAAGAEGPDLVLVPTGVGGHTVHPSGAPTSELAEASWLMPVLHLGAAVVTVLMLLHGEALVRRIIATLRLRATVLARAIDDSWSVPSSAAVRPLVLLVLPRGLQGVGASVSYRGPPTVMALG